MHRPRRDGDRRTHISALFNLLSDKQLLILLLIRIGLGWQYADKQEQRGHCGSSWCEVVAAGGKWGAGSGAAGGAKPAFLGFSLVRTVWRAEGSFLVRWKTPGKHGQRVHERLRQCKI